MLGLGSGRQRKVIAVILAVSLLVGITVVHSGLYRVTFHIQDANGERELEATGVRLDIKRPLSDGAEFRGDKMPGQETHERIAGGKSTERKPIGLQTRTHLEKFAPGAFKVVKEVITPPLTPISMAGSDHAVYKSSRARNNTESEKLGEKGTATVSAQMKAAVKEMMSFAWGNYETLAWGANELAPVTGHPIDGAISGTKMGLTIIDSLDTLYLMGMKEEFQRAREWCSTYLKKALDTPVYVSVFEFNIRVVGGLLSAYALSNDELFKDLAVYAADKLLPAFKSPTGIPYSRVDLLSGGHENYGWAGGSILSEVGSLHLEFVYLSQITGNPVYLESVMRARKAVKDAPKRAGLYANYINAETGQFSGDYHVAMGALGDSFYEYLLKAYLMNRKDTEARDMYFQALKAMKASHLLTETPGEKLVYFADYHGGRLDARMEHLACFSGGLLALSAGVSEDPEVWLTSGKEITKTCHESYIRSATHLGPETFGFAAGREARSRNFDNPMYILRPEVVESYYVLYSLTKDSKYRNWAWDAAQAINRTCRVAHGFSGISNVYLPRIQHDDHMQSFFLAETLKYLYLIFEDEPSIKLTDWVFNTEAHPLPIIQK